MPYFVILLSRLLLYGTNLGIILKFKLHYLPKFVEYFLLLSNTLGSILAYENNVLGVSFLSSQTCKLHLVELFALDQIQLLYINSSLSHMYI